MAVWVRGGSLVVALGLAVAACGGSNEPGTAAGSPARVESTSVSTERCDPLYPLADENPARGLSIEEQLASRDVQIKERASLGFQVDAETMDAVMADPDTRRDASYNFRLTEDEWAEFEFRQFDLAQAARSVETTLNDVGPAPVAVVLDRRNGVIVAVVPRPLEARLLDELQTEVPGDDRLVIRVVDAASGERPLTTTVRDALIDPLAEGLLQVTDFELDWPTGELQIGVPNCTSADAELIAAQVPGEILSDVRVYSQTQSAAALQAPTPACPSSTALFESFSEVDDECLTDRCSYSSHVVTTAGQVLELRSDVESNRFMQRCNQANAATCGVGWSEGWWTAGPDLEDLPPDAPMLLTLFTGCDD